MRAIVPLVVAVTAAAIAAGCGGEEAAPTEVVLVTHDSFAISQPVQRAFERQSGYTLRILQSGDAGEALSRALLTRGDPEGDVFFGVDDNLLTRALEEDLFVPYEADGLERVDERWLIDPEQRVTPVDHGAVCLNVDVGWFAERGLAPPASLDDLVEPRYRGLLVVQSPATSTPGLAFLLATVARYGEPGWQRWWGRLRRNGVLVVDGWTEAYTVRFSGAAGSKGTRPIVVSYASSPPAEVIFGPNPDATEAPTAVVESTCFRQVELAGILRGAPNEEGAQALVDFMLSERFQADVPLSMFVFPVRKGVPLPPAFERFAVVPERPLQLPAEEIGANRERWIREWTDVVLR